MRSLSILSILCVIGLAQPAQAQLAPSNAAGITFGHVHLSVKDAEVQKKMWVEQFPG